VDKDGILWLGTIDLTSGTGKVGVPVFAECGEVGQFSPVAVEVSQNQPPEPFRYVPKNLPTIRTLVALPFLRWMWYLASPYVEVA
jgi:hypothetical protein